MATASRSTRGLTLIEVLLVIAVIALLMAMLLPRLSFGLEASRRAQSHANLRSLAAVVTMYTSDHKDYYPALYPNTMYPQSEDLLFSDFWWTVAWNWPGVVYGYLPINHNIDTYVSPWAARRGIGSSWPTSYWYSTSFVGRPELWSGHAPSDYAYLAAQRAGDAVFPARKVLLWDGEFGARTHELKRDGPDIDEPMPMHLADGSGQDTPPSKASQAVPNPFQHLGYDLRLQNTRDGLRGIDIQ
ncbi:MAG: type II secretion system protein [Phycisphaeraceae bacterium]|nr:type II secretion system protein [Phycisphaeraceae bacterium]